MDFILRKINQHIDIINTTGDVETIRTHLQSRIEYILTLILAYLWNKNFDALDETDKELTFAKILQPSIGTIIDVCRTLDVDKEFFGNKTVSKCINEYPSIRNTILGHGYTYEDKITENDKGFEELYQRLIESNRSFLSDNIEYVHVIKSDGTIYKGIKYGDKIGEISPWSMPKELGKLEDDTLYILFNDVYYKVSPFILIQKTGDEIFIFNKITEKLNGRIHYNQLIYTGVTDIDWIPFSNFCLSSDGFKERTSNGTIRNVYENNYTHYIDVGVHKELINFLDKNKASVIATLWGHGGIGKTATIQNVCDYYANKDYKTFDYIIFLSAKDRRYNYYKGVIEPIDGGITTFSEIISVVNKLINGEEVVNESYILEYSGKMLLVIDDFESFAKEEAQKISAFITRLDINHHKVVITTRSANLSIGQEIKTNELNEEQTYDFLTNIFANEDIPISTPDKKLLETKEYKKQVYNITSGRPLFIYQLAYIIGQKGVITAVKNNIKGGSSAIDFLYGRIYEYLSPKAKDIFVAMGLLVSKDDLVNVLDKVKYIVNMENDEDAFEAAVDELKKLKIVKLSDEDRTYYELYSKEILELMNKQYEQRDQNFIKNCNTRRNQVNKDKKADIDHSLLNSANSNRLAKSSIEIEESYKQIMNRPGCPLDIKLAALMNLTSYLLLDCGKRQEALDYFEKYSHFFVDIAYGDKDRKLYASYVLRWSNLSWATGNDIQKKKAITILGDYVKTGIDYGCNYDLEIMSQLLMYKCIFLLNEWRELKDQYQLNEISKMDFEKRRESQKAEFKSIRSKIGEPLSQKVLQSKIAKKPSSTKQSIITALHSYIELLVRVGSYNRAIELCEYVTNCGPSNFVMQFRKKKEWIESLR